MLAAAFLILIWCGGRTLCPPASGLPKRALTAGMLALNGCCFCLLAVIE